MSFMRVVSSLDYSKLELLAEQLQQEQNIDLDSAKNLTASKYGFEGWEQVSQGNLMIKPSEQAFKDGYILVFDCKEGMDLIENIRYSEKTEPDLIDDGLLEITMEYPMFTLFGELSDEDEPEKAQKNTLSEEQLKMYFSDWFSGFTFIRVAEKFNNTSIEELLEIVREYSFWTPLYIWSKGKCISTHDEPILDGNDNIVGIRF